jgi:DNA anti-recombination protein RmuC
MTFEFKQIETAVSVFSFLGGAFSWYLNTRIKQHIASSNARMVKEIQAAKDQIARDLAALNEKLTAELSNVKDRMIERTENMDRQLIDLKGSLSDRVLTIVNGKYVRRDLHKQSMDSVNDHFAGIQRLIEVNLDRIESSINRQIDDLKERIFSSRRKDD